MDYKFLTEFDLKSLLPELLIVLLIAAGILVVCSVLRFILKKLKTKEWEDREKVLLELTFPSDSNRTANASEQLHILLASISKTHGLLDRIAGIKQSYSLEIVAAKESGIRYMLAIPKDQFDFVSRNVLSFLPGLKSKVVEDYLITAGTNASIRVEELTLGRHYSLPLTPLKDLDDYDPMAFLTGQMTKLGDNELLAFQIIVAPLSRHTHPWIGIGMRQLQKRIYLKKDISEKLDSNRLRKTARILGAAILFVVSAFMNILTSIIEVFTSDSRNASRPTQVIKSEQNLYEQELSAIVGSKLGHKLFETSIRIIAINSGSKPGTSRIRSLFNSLEPFSNTHQNLEMQKHHFFKSRAALKQLELAQRRQLSQHVISYPTILSSSELADLYHIPNMSLTKTEDLVKSRSGQLPAPRAFSRQDTKLDVIVGKNEHGGEEKLVGMTIDQRQKHTYIIGKTGTGKTKLIENLIYQDMQNNKGLAFFDPHGDAYRQLLRMVPMHRRKDIVILDPSDRKFPVGINILDPGIKFANKDDKHEWITSAVISVFAKLADESQWGPRMEHILRNATMTALQLPNPSLFTLQHLLTSKSYQKHVAKTLKDPVLKQFWAEEFKLMGTMQMSAATAPLTHRLGHFLTSKMSRHILLQEKSTISISKIMDSGKILLINLSKGDIGEDQSFFFGTIMTSLIWMAAYQRTKIPEAERKDFFVYVDEFQNFATKQFGDITSEGRKFHISLIVSHQNIAQVKDKDLVKIIAGNAASIICLRANPEDEAFILPYMRPEVKAGDIVNLPPYNFYMKVNGEHTEEAFSGKTILHGVHSSEQTAERVIKASRKKYATDLRIVEKHMEILFRSDTIAAVKTKLKPLASNKPSQVKHKKLISL